MKHKFYNILLVLLVVVAGCKREYDYEWPIEDLVIYNEIDGTRVESVSVKTGTKVVFAKPEGSPADIDRRFKYSLWPGDAGHDFTYRYDYSQNPFHEGLDFPGSEIQYIYNTAGTYDIVYVIRLFNLNDNSSHEKTVVRQVTVTD
jgi:hypothetical protein